MENLKKIPQVGVQVFQHSVLVLNCLEDDLHHVRAVTVSMGRVRTCSDTNYCNYSSTTMCIHLERCDEFYLC